jgi:hypothetical protein
MTWNMITIEKECKDGDGTRRAFVYSNNNFNFSSNPCISNAIRSPRQRIHGRRSRIILENDTKTICNDFSPDLLYPRIVSKKIRHYANRRYYKYLSNQNTTTYTSIIRIILLSGDISTNPGPVKYHSGKCSKPVKRNQRGIYCEDCTYWYHIKCIDLPIGEYQRLSTSSESWYCANCICLFLATPFLILKM